MSHRSYYFKICVVLWTDQAKTSSIERQIYTGWSLILKLDDYGLDKKNSGVYFFEKIETKAGCP